MATKILPCGRVETQLRVNTHGSCDGIVDTGAELSILPWHPLSAALKASTVGPGVTASVGGAKIHTMTVTAPVIEIDVEPHGGGSVTTSQCAQGVQVHFATSGQLPLRTVTSQALLGMDLLDGLGADATKELSCKRAYMVSRV